MKITLKGSKPSIFRTIIINPELKLPKFHNILQDLMGWQDYHLHQFVKGKEHYGVPSSDDYIDVINYKNVKIIDLIEKIKDKIIYEYDFGDGWEHEIVLEKIIEENEEYNVKCLKGSMNCPPEDCGGIHGFYDLLEIIKDPNHEEYVETIEWLGDDYDPEYFDLDDLNKLLKKYNKIKKKS